MKSAKEFWKEKYDEYPQNDAEKLVVAMMAEYSKELQEDITFLVERSMKSSGITFGSERDTGMSSNSIVAIAYEVSTLENQCLPSDLSDMISCENMWIKLPANRRNGDAAKAMKKARSSNYYGKKSVV